MTLSGLHQRFLQHCEVERRLARQTIIGYRCDFGQFLEFLREQGRWGLPSQDQVRAFSETNIRDYQYHMAAMEWRTNTVRRRLVELNRFGTWLLQRGHLTANPLAEIIIPKRPHLLPPVVEWSVVEQAVATERQPRARAILALLAYAGLRRGEVMGANVGDYAGESQHLRVHGKGSKDRVVPLPGPAIEALEGHLRHRWRARPEEPLFITRHGRISHQVVSAAVRRAGRRLGVKLYPHLFRHTYATELLNRKADLRVIQKLLGHESVATTKIYTHVSTARQREAVQLLEGPAKERQITGITS
jgi:site-specific recombinase XerD